MSKVPAQVPVDLESLTDLAQQLVLRNLHAEAADLLSLALGHTPHDDSLRATLEELRAKAKNGTPLAESSSTDSRSRSKAARQAEKSSRNGHGDGAAALREKLRRNAIDAAQFCGLASLYAERGDARKATEYLEVARRKAEAPRSYKLRGMILLRRGELDGAAEELRRARRLDPFDREIAQQLSRAELELKQYGPALEAATDAFLLLNRRDGPEARTLRRQIRQLKKLRRFSKQELIALFHERRLALQTAFDRLRWHRQQILEEGSPAPAAKVRAKAPIAPPSRRPKTEALVPRLRKFSHWADLNDGILELLASVARVERHSTSSRIFAYGHTGTDIFLLEEGQVSIRRPTTYGTFEISTLGPGDFFGEVNFITRQERSGDAVALTDICLLRLETTALEQLIKDHASCGAEIYWALWRDVTQKLRSTNEQLKAFFAPDSTPENFLKLRRGMVGKGGEVEVDARDKISLLRDQGLSSEELDTLAGLAAARRFEDQAQLFLEGSPGTEMYVILEGRVLISTFIPGGGEEALAILERGEFFGEMALLDGQPRSASAKAFGGPLTLVAFDQETLGKIRGMEPAAALPFIRLLCHMVCQRLREIDEKVTLWTILADGQPSEAMA